MAARNYQIIYGGRMMIKKIINCWIRHKTKNLTEIPLFTMTFNYRKIRHRGRKIVVCFIAIQTLPMMNL